MKNITILLLIIFVFNSNQLYAFESKTDTVYFRGNMNYPPYQQLTKKNKAIGFSVDLLHAIEETMDINVIIDLGHWENIKKQLINNKIDGVVAMTYSKERKKNVNFSVPYSYVSYSIFTRNNNQTIKSIKDINNKEVIVIKDDIMHDYLINNDITKHIFPADNYIEAIQSLSKGQYDCVLIDNVLGQYTINKYNLENLKSIKTNIKPMKLCFGINKNNPELLGIINDGLQILKTTGKYQEIYDKWFSIYEKNKLRNKIIKSLLYIFTPILLILILILIWSRSLQRQVARKTSELQKELHEKETIRKELAFEKSLTTSMINSIKDLIFYKDKNNTYLGCNKAFAKFHGKSIEDIIGMTTDELYPYSKSNNYINFDNTVLQRKISAGFESHEKDTKGNSYIFDIQITPFVGTDNDIIGIVGICRDITNRHKTELALKDAKEKAEASDKLKSAFLTNMSHEIRTPMNAIIGFSEILVNDDIDADDKEELVSQINNNCNILLHLIDDIIDLAKIESNELAITKKTTNVSDLLFELYEEFSETKKHQLLKIQFSISETEINKELHINTDPYRLRQIITNLLNNAFKYTEEGEIKFGYKIVKNNIVFFIKDTGIGIAEDKYSVIFDRFMKIEDNKLKLFRGTGLGLAISKNLTNLLGGKIWLESELKVGSTFYFSIPLEIKNLVEETKTNESENKKLINHNKTNKTILIVEDEDSNYKFLQLLLENKFKILRAKTGKKALNIFNTNKDISLILMDIKLPEINGLEVTKLIRKKNQSIPIIAQTAYAMENNVQDSLDAGCNAYISKPINKNNFFDLLNKYI
ncbi:MAG: transporter substrate-binding domain-containing protein [Bacteroidota bacterium]|nr:transporter substrate-binding domain-containing protein [Bacteroidota bacterium]